VIVGEEIMTTQGELLRLLSRKKFHLVFRLKAIELLRAQEAFIKRIASLRSLRDGHWKEADLLEIVPFG